MWEAIAIAVLQILGAVIPAAIKSWAISNEEKAKLLKAWDAFVEDFRKNKVRSAETRKTAKDQIERLKNDTEEKKPE